MEKINFETIKSKDALSAYAITVIGIIEIVAISQGINGTLLATALAILGGLGGFYRGKRTSEP